MSEPVTIAWSVWHPDHKWGLTTPMLWVSEEVAIAKAKDAGLYPLRNGWQFIQVEVRPVAVPSQNGATYE